MRVLVVVPTTGGPLVLEGLKPRPGLPASAAFARGDYRPLPWSGDYARLTGPAGPIGAALGQALAPHEARLSGSFDTGRSWEAPLALAHLLLAAGHALVADSEQAELVLWSTGAVDLDLQLIPGDYALLDKIEASAALLSTAGGPVAVLLPPGPGQAEAGERLATLNLPRGLRRLSGTGLVGIAEALAADPSAAARGTDPSRVPRTAPPPARPNLPWRPIAAVLLADLGGAGIWWAARPAPPPAVQRDGPERTRETPRPVAAPDRAGEGARALAVEEWHAPAGSSCRQVLFGAAAPVARPVPAREGGEAGTLAPSRLGPGLCGLAFKVSDPDRVRFSVGRELAEVALTPVRGPDGALVYYLRQGLERNVVYTAQVSREENGVQRPLAPVRHALER